MTGMIVLLHSTAYASSLRHTSLASQSFEIMKTQCCAEQMPSQISSHQSAAGAMSLRSTHTDLSNSSC
eukprot:CAMPEP_0184653984 /NCGR_PEP_ID=MMETSP0308-20130426/11686_1 /TAXON_ID=38269 /ORGANISM="Gloeochaete witrockiana, Strain SAG 46.84" /LENGTH=67 /DNA_ID=CAMNT_0027089729 /DNA_START=724 /DNA_END=924 /DNA_ORIENTATION=-